MELNEFLPLNDTIKNIGEAHHSDIVRKIIENGEWFIEGLYKEGER